jgi:hypothetical protein
MSESFDEWHERFEPEKFFGTQYHEARNARKALRRQGWDAALAAAAGEGQWVAVGERLPTPLESVMVFEGHLCRGSIRETRIGIDFVTGSRHWDGSSTITHWMPLPKPPRRSGGRATAGER